MPLMSLIVLRTRPSQPKPSGIHLAMYAPSIPLDASIRPSDTSQRE
jgi:hypothetical protein